MATREIISGPRALDVSPATAGLQLVGWLPRGVDDRTAAEGAVRRDIETAPLSAYRIRPGARGGLVLGYTGFTPPEIRGAVTRLARVLEGP